MQRYNIFRRKTIVVPAVVSGCPGSCEKSSSGNCEEAVPAAGFSYVPTKELLRGDAGIATWRRRKRGMGESHYPSSCGGAGQKGQKAKGQKSKRSKVTFHDLSLLMFLYPECSI